MSLIHGIVDLHHSDGVFDPEAFVRLDGGVAVIHKATEGRDFTDRSFASVMPRLKDHGLLGGAYHFANATEPSRQAEHFLATVQKFPDALLVLDCESNKSSFGTMNFAQAAEFVSIVHTITGRWPVFYTYESMLFSGMQSASPETRATLAKCPLWIAKYGPPPKKLPESWGAWKVWSLWQYSSSTTVGPADEVKYPRGFESFARKSQDRSCFRGSKEDLQLWWKTCGLVLT